MFADRGGCSQLSTMLRACRGHQLVRPHKKFPGESWCLIPEVQKSKKAVSKLKGKYREKKNDLRSSQKGEKTLRKSLEK